MMKGAGQREEHGTERMGSRIRGKKGGQKWGWKIETCFLFFFFLFFFIKSNSFYK